MSQARFERVSDDLDRMAQMSCALEAYGEILRSQAFDPSSPVGKAIGIGLEAIDPNIDIKEGSKVTLRAIKEGLIALAKMTRNAIRILFETIQSFYVKFTGSLGAVRSKHKRVGKQLGRLGSRVAYTKMTITGVNRLSVNGEFIGDDPASLQGILQVTEFILNTYPRAVANVSRDTSRRFVNLVEDAEDKTNKEIAKEAISLFAQSLHSKLTIPASFVSASHKELPPGFKDMGTQHRSLFMPGNYALVLSHPSEIQSRAEKTQATNYATVINNAFTCKFIELPLNTADRGAREVEVPSIQVLNQLYQGISNILSVAERGESGVEDFKTVKSIVDDAIRQVAERSRDVSNANNVVIHMLGAMSQKLAEPMGSFTHWLAITLNVYLAYMDHCIKHYQEEGV